MLYFMRALLLVFASLSGYYIALQILGDAGHGYIGFISGILIAVCAIVFEERVKKAPLRVVLGGALGLITGLVVANLLTYPLVLNFLNNRYLELSAYLLTNFVIGYLGLTVGMKKGAEFTRLLSADELSDMTSHRVVIDTSVIIDGRIADIAGTGFMDGSVVIVPQFVLAELQSIADSYDQIKRARGKRGLDILQRMQKEERIKVEITETDFPQIKSVDAKLVELAKKTGARVLTNDSNLTKVAELQGIGILNINALAAALKPTVLPGEVMRILVVKEGREAGQGVGYLDDGTMVVIDNAREHVGKAIDVSVTSVLQTTGGRMIFSKVAGDQRNSGLLQVSQASN